MIKRLKKWFSLYQGQNGLTLIETIVGLAIFAVIAVPLLSGLSTGYKSLDISRERTYAESLAKSQLENLKRQEYISVVNYDPDDPEKRYEVIDILANMTGYSIEIESPVLIEAAGVSGYELQSTDIIVKRHDKGILTITFYRTGLAL